MNDVERLLQFMRERHRIYLRRFVEKLPPPWTEDPILQRYKFCNIYRELDRVTVWIREHIREPYAQHPQLWFMLAAARQINWPDTLAELIEDRRGAWPRRAGRWSPERACKIMRARAARGDKVYTGAYMIRGAGRNKGPREAADKPHYTVYRVLVPLWEQRKDLSSKFKHTLRGGFEALRARYGWGDFMAAQVIADLKYTPGLSMAPDWWDWAVLGPGSRRGLTRVLGDEITHGYSEDEALQHLGWVREYVEKHSDLERLCLQDVQSALCEYDKYERTRLGEGRPRSRFNGTM